MKRLSIEARSVCSSMADGSRLRPRARALAIAALTVLAAPLLPCLGSAAEPLRIAVAPFTGESPERPVTQALAGRLAQRRIERLITPDAFLATSEFEPTASVIRQWAYNASVDTVVVGRIVGPAGPGASTSAYDVEIVLRSGHSGAEIGRYGVSIGTPDALDVEVDRLAADLLSALGYKATEGVDAGPHRDPRSPEPPIFGASDSETDGVEGGEGGLANGFELGQLREETPIEINAEEAEIVDRGADRKLVFQRNVRVRQGDVRLASDLLEAEYRKGQPEPDRLIAKGSVQVDQGFRRARCDRAIYLRAEQTLSCEGRAELVQGCDVVRGDSIEFDLAGDQAHVVGAASIVIRPGEVEGKRCTAPEETL